jgi:hypothetical protein
MVEVVVSTFVAFAISAALQQWVVSPLFQLNTTHGQNLLITVFFTVVSLVRSYLFRRAFNYLHRSKQ